MATSEPYDWRPGSTQLQFDGADAPTLCLVFDGEGLYRRGMFRVGKRNLQYAAERHDEPARLRKWRDATEMWPALPPWLRRQVTDALQLHAVF